ncbi:hypothetical protein ACG2LH_03730 [Zhouia sp. PK063]|uniref:hypothetical protein n=1 Tax=Zhouia sp. PK063 TaxID=3373602 RepID=UPI0037B559CF
MKSYIATLLVVLLISASCKQNTREQQNMPENEASSEMINDSTLAKMDKEEAPTKICFMQVKNDKAGMYEKLKDSVMLSLVYKDSTVTGNYNWLPAEKDARIGTIKATKTGNTIKGTYTFMQEGQTQKRDISIRLIDSTAQVTTMLDGKKEMEQKVTMTNCAKNDIITTNTTKIDSTKATN